MSREVQDYRTLYLPDRVRALGPSQFVDIGASGGEFTQGIRHDVSKVWSIEPNPVVFLALIESFRGVQNVELIEAGIDESTRGKNTGIVKRP
jgi:hypothetical protein